MWAGGPDKSPITMAKQDMTAKTDESSHLAPNEEAKRIHWE